MAIKEYDKKRILIVGGGMSALDCLKQLHGLVHGFPPIAEQLSVEIVEAGDEFAAGPAWSEKSTGNMHLMNNYFTGTERPEFPVGLLDGLSPRVRELMDGGEIPRVAEGRWFRQDYNETVEALRKAGVTIKETKHTTANNVFKLDDKYVVETKSKDDHPVIEEVQKATVGTGVLMTFRDRGVNKAVVLKAGSHYKESSYMIAGGFLDLSKTPGTLLTPADPAKAEDPRVGAIRELEEEMRDDKGAPLLTIDPARLKPTDTKSITLKNGERRLVIGFTLDLTPQEVKTVQDHVDRLEHDAAYREAVRAHTINPDSAAPEVATVSIVKLDDLATGKAPLLHPDQSSLFHLASQNMAGGHRK